MPILSSKLARNTLALMAAGMAVLLLIMLFSYWLVNATRDSARDVEIGRDVRIAASTILIDLVDAETGQRGYLLTGRENYLAPYEQTKLHLAESVKKLSERGHLTPEIAGDIAQIRELVAEKMQEVSNTIEIYRAGRREEAIAMVQTDRGKETMDEVRAILDRIIFAMNSRVTASLSELGKSAERLSMVTIFGGLSIAVFSGLAFYIVNSHTRRLVEAQQEVRALNENLEERVADRTTALTRANDEIQRFAYIVSHDLRAPLVNIMGFTSELEVSTGQLKTYFDNDPPTADQTSEAKQAAEIEIPEAVHFIRASTSKMDALIGSILKLSREGRREMKRERVDLHDLVSKAALTLQHQLDSADATIEIPESLPSVVADRLALEQIFGNILDNAVKYLARGRPGRIEVSGTEAGGRVSIKITDNGRGIDPKDMERIFELFRRAGAQDRPGDGVGLAHVRALARRLGGDVIVTSKVGEGSTFEVDLPKKTRLRETSAES
jgi:signal transduction histidine kinase